MTPQEFLDEFGTLAESAAGVPKLRELILELAVRGKLLEQDETDGEASDLHTTILSKCRNLELKGAPRKKHESIPVPLADEPFSIPANWKWVSLGDFGVMLGGGTPSKQNPAFWDGDIPWVSPKDMKVSHIADAIDHVTQDGIDQSSAKLIPKNAMLMVVRGMILIHSFPVALSQRELAINQDMKAIVLGDARIGEFLLRAAAGLRDQMLARVERSSHGTCRIDSDSVSGFPIPLPPLAEQHRIVSKVDELMGLCDRLEAVQGERRGVRVRLNRSSLDRLTSVSGVGARQRGSELSAAWQRVCDHFEVLYDTPETLPDLRQTILQLAVQGKLVPQDPNDEPAEVTVNTARKQADKPKIELNGESATNAEFSTPESWRWVTVKDVADHRLGKMLDQAKNTGNPQPYLRNTNVHWFRFELDSIKEMPFKDDELAEFEVARGDLMICEGGHGIARTAVWESELPYVMFQKALHRVRPLNCVDSYFLAFCLRVYEATGILQRYYTGAGIPHFTGKSLAKVVFPLPPLSEQKRIVSKVTHLLSQVTRLESTLTRRESTRTQLLTAAIHAILESDEDQR